MRCFILLSFIIIFISSHFLAPVFIQAQTLPPDWETYFEQFEETTEQSQLLEQLEDRLKHPLNLNRASLEEMLMIPGFPERGVIEILHYRKTKGDLPSMKKAKRLLAVDEELWDWISQFVTVKTTKSQIKWEADCRFRTAREIEQNRGQRENVFAGSPLKIYQRYRLRIPDTFQLSFLLEKDDGEPDINDHHVFNLAYDCHSLRSRIIIGNYTLNIGKGLMLWSPFSVRKGVASFYAVSRSSRLIRSYLSSYEAQYFQGIAFHSNPKYWDIVGWYSDVGQDANITDGGVISSFYESGYHRSTIEQMKENQAKSKSLGGLIGFNGIKDWRVQFSMMETNFNPSIAPSNINPVGWELAGDRMQVAGFNVHGNFGPFTTFCETVLQKHHGNALLVGGKGQWDTIKLLLLYRYYSPKYDNPYAHGFGEWANTRNETGWYIAWRFSPFDHVKFTMAADHFGTLWRTFRNPVPTKGNDLFLQWEQRINRSFRFYCRYDHDQKTTSKESAFRSPLQRQLMIPFNKQRLRFHFYISPSKKSQIRGRFETIHYTIENQFSYPLKKEEYTGWLLYWGFRSQVRKNLRISARVTLFDSPEYESRLYQFENDLPGVMKIKLLYGRGIRFYGIIEWELFHCLELSAKYASTRYTNRETIGSGWDEILSPVEHFFSLQLDVEL